MCQRDNNLTKEQKTAIGRQWVFNTGRKIPHSEKGFSWPLETFLIYRPIIHIFIWQLQGEDKISQKINSNS